MINNLIIICTLALISILSLIIILYLPSKQKVDNTTDAVDELQKLKAEGYDAYRTADGTVRIKSKIA